MKSWIGSYWHSCMNWISCCCCWFVIGCNYWLNIQTFVVMCYLCCLLSCYYWYSLSLHFTWPTNYSFHSTSLLTPLILILSPAFPLVSSPPLHFHVTILINSQYPGINYYCCCCYYIVVSHHSFISVSYFITILSNMICLFIACSYVMGRSFSSTGLLCSNCHYGFGRLFPRYYSFL